MEKISSLTDRHLPSDANTFDTSLQKSAEAPQSQNGLFSVFSRNKKLDNPNQLILRDDASKAIQRTNDSQRYFNRVYTPALQAAQEVADRSNLRQGNKYFSLDQNGNRTPVPLHSSAVVRNSNGTYEALDLVSQLRQDVGTTAGATPRNEYQTAYTKLSKARAELHQIIDKPELTKKDQSRMNELNKKIAQYDNTIRALHGASNINGVQTLNSRPGSSR